MHLQAEGDSFLHDGICSKLPASQVLPEVYKNMEVAGPHNDIWTWTAYGAVAGRRGTALPTVPILRPVISISTNFLYAVIQTFVPWWDKCLNVHGNYMESDVHNLQPMCHACIKARIKF